MFAASRESGYGEVVGVAEDGLQAVPGVQLASSLCANSANVCVCCVAWSKAHCDGGWRDWTPYSAVLSNVCTHLSSVMKIDVDVRANHCTEPMRIEGQDDALQRCALRVAFHGGGEGGAQLLDAGVENAQVGGPQRVPEHGCQAECCLHSEPHAREAHSSFVFLSKATRPSEMVSKNKVRSRFWLSITLFGLLCVMATAESSKRCDVFVMWCGQFAVLASLQFGCNSFGDWCDSSIWSAARVRLLSAFHVGLLGLCFFVVIGVCAEG